jgi:phosphatidylinositol glycan class B
MRTDSQNLLNDVPHPLFGNNGLSGTWDRNISLIIFSGFIIQMISALNAIGYYHPDQHHSIIEFATYKLGITPFNLMTREFPEQVRQTLQVYLFLGFYQAMQFLHLGDPYTAHTILRIITSLLNFTLFNYIILRTFRNDSRLTLYLLLLSANFSWAFPFIKTLFSSETFGGLTYFSAILLYRYLSARSMTVWKGLLVGFVLSLAFFFRFQMGFAMIGLGIWLLFFEKASLPTISGIALGFLIGTVFNVLLDSHYYGQFAFTPYTYWKINVIQGRAMSTNSVWIYVGVLSVALTAPPLSVIFLFFLGRGLIRTFRDPYSLSVIFFLLGHFLIPHKEDRFLFPIFGILPVILGYGLRDYLNKLPVRIREADLSSAVKVVVLISVLINTILLILLLFVPVAQHIEFSKRLNQYFNENTPVTVIFYQRTPYETPFARNVATYYLHGKKPNIAMKTIQERSEFLGIVKDHEPNTYFVSTRNRLVKDHLLQEMDCKTLLISSSILLHINTLVERMGGPVLPELWALYACGGERAK